MEWGRRRECAQPEFQRVRARARPFEPGCSGRWIQGRIRRSYVLSLWIAGKHLDDEIVQAIVELLLKNPGKLLALNFARAQQEHVGVNLGLWRRKLDDHFDAF